MLGYNLSKAGFAILTAANGNEALSQIAEHPVSLVILDIMMPGPDGFEVCRRIRANDNTKAVPVIFLTARSTEVDQIVGFELGADDYIQKPISPRLLVARVQSMLRRTEIQIPSNGDEARVEVITIDDLEIDRLSYRVTLCGSEISFRRKEFDLLFYLASHQGRVFTRDALLNQVWGEDAYVNARTVDVHIFKIREKLGALGTKIETVTGIGYRFSK